MARTNTKPVSQQPNAPDFLAWHVVDKGDKSFWNMVGAAWRHKDDRDYTLHLDVDSINGRSVLRQPLEGPESQKQDDKGRA
ncbi:hypothetical protein [Halomonas sp. MMSF_3323]|uniref:hypothetical protein n=1 Tax=Halomonas sp. MMSF_3323 TaxID=3046701 RepID=UPI00273D8993|nr:hypothetical protein [Halomonas sp. MMSF_3323]